MSTVRRRKRYESTTTTTTRRRREGDEEEGGSRSAARRPNDQDKRTRVPLVHTCVGIAPFQVESMVPLTVPVSLWCAAPLPLPPRPPRASLCCCCCAPSTSLENELIRRCSCQTGVEFAHRCGMLTEEEKAVMSYYSGANLPTCGGMGDPRTPDYRYYILLNTETRGIQSIIHYIPEITNYASLAEFIASPTEIHREQYLEAIREVKEENGFDNFEKEDGEDDEDRFFRQLIGFLQYLKPSMDDEAAEAVW
eukprot:436654-Rhodomonas_salina.3